MGEIKTKELRIDNLPVKSFRQRCFVKRSEALYGSNYGDQFVDNLPEQVEALPGFTNWESFSEEWDVYWVGLDPKTMSWISGRHNSPIRKLVTPLRIMIRDERTGRMQESFVDRADVQKMKVPSVSIPETEEDRIISESLSGKVVVDEPDHDKALRAIQANIEALTMQLAQLKK